MPPERNVPAKSRALAADTCRIPQPAANTAHTAKTASDTRRAYGMPSSYRSGSRIDEGGRPADVAGGETALKLCCSQSQRRLNRTEP